MPRAVFRTTLATLVLAGAPAVAFAQARDSSAAERPRQTVLSINPLGLPFKYAAGEWEQRASGKATVGIAASYLGVDDASYTSAELKLRLYPNEEAFRGFSLGVAGGLSRISDLEYTYNPSGGESTSRKTESRPTIAVIVDYNWLLGKSKTLLVGTGIGAKRILGKEDGFGGINFAYPTARFQIGVLF